MSKRQPSKAFGSRRRVRALASDERAGSGARRQARELLSETVRRHKKVVPVFVVTYVAIALIIWFTLQWSREFFLGAWTATIVAVFHHFMWQVSGAVNYELGSLGEQWTAQALRKSQTSGWRLINDIYFDGWNIDHILVGPGGVVVLETKTTSKSWGDRDQEPWLAKASGQAARSTRRMRNFLRPHLDGATVVGVVVLWPDRDALATREADGVTILGGKSLPNFVRDLDVDLMSEDSIDRVYEELCRYVVGRDARRLEDDGPAPRSFEDWIFEFLQLIVGVFTGSAASVLVLQLKPWPAAYVGLGALIVATAVAHRRLRALTALITGVSIGCLLVVGTMVVYVATNGW